MILTDIELRSEIREGRLIFEPEILIEGPSRQLQTSTIDLLLGPHIRTFKESLPTGFVAYIDPSAQGFKVNDILIPLTEQHDLDKETSFLMKEGQSILASTLEKVTIPPHLCARVEGRSSLARLGLTIHNTAPYIHPGYSDTITLEMHYTGKVPLLLKPKELRICQLILERVSSPPVEPYPGAYRQ